VLIDITKDAQQSTCEFDWEHTEAPSHPARPDRSGAPAEFERALELINSAKRPLILAGHGILLSGSTAEVQELAEKASMPMAMTLLGIGGIPASHPLNLGMMGMHGEAWVNTAIQEADLLVALGMRFDDRVTGNLKSYAPNAKKIHVEIDPAEVNKNVPVDVGLIGDLRQVLQQLLPEVERGDRSEWLAHIADLKGEVAVRDIQNLPDNGHLYAAHVISDLWRETEGKAVVVSDVGQHQMWEAQYYKHEDPHSLITSGGLGTMGFALPAAMGAKFARPHEEVWVVVGDGGFQMTMSELATIAQEGLELKVAIINNGYLGMVRQWQEFFYDRRYSATPLVNPDFEKLAQAYGLCAMTVRTRSEVIPTVRAARAHRGTVVLNFCVEQEDSVFPMVPAGAALHDMIRRPNPLVEASTDA
jgi:acetolactate synthase-1/2/3 large subunit